MSERPLARLRRFFAELKRRSVYQVAVAYAVVGFVLIEAADLIFPALNIPPWAYSLVVVLVLFGFPIALVLAWAFEVTPEGVRRTPDAGAGRQSDGTRSLPAAGETTAGTSAPDVASSAHVDTGSAETARRKSRRAVQAFVALGILAVAAAGGWYLVGGGGEAGSEPPSRDHSIAVLPFASLGQEEPGPTAEGMHVALLNSLSQVAALQVMADRSVQPYRGTELSAEKIAEELSVRWIVEGEVEEADGRMQVSVRLTDPRTNTQAWGQSYVREVTAGEYFDLRSEIARQITRELEAEVTPDEQERVDRRPTEDLEAFELYRQGRVLLYERTLESVRQAVDYFERALDRDSTYALAWAGLADARLLEPFFVPASSLEYLPDAVEASIPDGEAAARRALALDSTLAEAHASMGFVHLLRQEGPSAVRALERAVDLKPSYAQAHHWLGAVLLNVGRPTSALEHYRRAVDLTPQNPSVRDELIEAEVANRNYEEALRQLRRARQRYPGVGWWRAYELVVRAHLGQWSEVEDVARGLLASDSADTWGNVFLALAAAETGDVSGARARVEASPNPGLRTGVALAATYAALGERGRALSSLERFYAQPDVWAGYRGSVWALRYYFPDQLGQLRGEPRYRELVREANAAWNLNSDGSFPDG